MKTRILALLLFLSLVSAGAQPTAARPSPSASAVERLIAAEVVPHKKPHGEVRLLLRDDAVVLQTILYSKILKRVISAIQRKENNFWPDSKAGHSDSQRYIDTLAQNFAEIWAGFKQRKESEERRQGMLIEFVLGEKTARIEIFAPALSGQPGSLKILERRSLKRLEVSRRYAIGALVEISRDSLGLSEQALLTRLEAVQPAPDWLRTELLVLQEKE